MHEDLVTSIFLNELATALGIAIDDISLDQDLVDLGVDSTVGFRFIAACRERGLILNFHHLFGALDIKTLISSLTIVKNDAYRNESVRSGSSSDDSDDSEREHLSNTPDSSLESVILGSEPCDSQDREIDTPEGTCYPMTEMQVTFLAQSLRHPGSNIITYREDHSPDRLPALKAAWESVIRGEEIFRTRFDLDKRQAVVLDDFQASFQWDETGFSDIVSFEKQLNTPFQSSNDAHILNNTFRVLILNNDLLPKQCCMLWHVHHALVDGHSAHLIIEKVQRVLTGNAGTPGHSFARVARGISSIQHAERHRAEKFWAEENKNFESAVDTLNLPPDRSNDAPVPHNRDLIRLATPSLHDSSPISKVRVSAASLYHAAWALTLAKCADSACVKYGTVLSSRNLPIPGISETIGPVLNTLPLNLQVFENHSSTEFLAYVSHRLQELMDVSWSVPEHGFNRKLFSVINVDVMNDNYVQSPLVPLARPTSSASLDIPLVVTIHNDGLATFEFDKVQVSEDSVRTLAEMFSRSITRLLNQSLRISEIVDDLVSEAAREDLLYLGNSSTLISRENSTKQDLLDLFNLAAYEHGQSIAVEKGSQRLTYFELDSRSQQVSNALCSMVDEDDVVCVDADRSIEWIIAIYGALRTGAIYCPIDPSLPHHLKEDIVKTAKARVFLTYRHALEASSLDVSCPTLVLEDLLEQQKSQSSDSQSLNSTHKIRDRPRGAYLCFTSGSSGKPKGVLCSHEALVAFQRPLNVRMKARAGWRVAQFLSPGFDGCIHEIFSTLSYGATLVLWPGGDPLTYLNSVDATMLTPSVAHVLDPNQFPRLKVVVLCGEPVPQAVCDIWASEKEVFNMYGPTEGTCAAAYTQMLPGMPVTLGQPVPSARVYLLDNTGRLVHRGFVGEICIAGIQVAKGYVGGTAQVASRFTSDHVLPELGERMYRTGDRGYWDSRGHLCILGRIDRQIKLRGFRIDLSDVETRIQKAAPQCSAVAIARSSDAIYCFVQPKDISAEEVMSEISHILPSYALPKAILPRDSFPLTANGKLDYSALVASINLATPSAPTKAMSKLELKIARVWKEVLQLQETADITGESNFLSLGGSSVTQIMLYNKLSTALKRDVPLRYILDNPTLKKLAQRLEDTSHTQTPMPKPTESLETGHHISAMEKYWWRAYQRKGCTATFTVPFACHLGGDINVDRLETVWNDTLAMYPIFRRRYTMDCQQKLRKFEWGPAPRVYRVDTIDLQKELAFTFNLSTTAPIRVLLSSDTMLVEMSHIISDLTSMRHLLGYVHAWYAVRQQPDPLKVSMNGLVKCKNSQMKQANFWKTYLNQPPQPSSQLSVSSESPEQPYHGQSHVFKLPETSCKALQSLLTSHGATFYQSLLTACFTLLLREEAHHDVVLGSPHFNRSSTEEFNAIGLFVQPLPVRLQAKDALRQSTQPLWSLLQHVQESSQAALENAMPWEGLLEALGHDAEADMNTLFDVMVSYHDERRVKHFMTPQANPLYVWTPGAKFKLMIEFTSLSDDCILTRIEYDSTRICAKYVHTLSTLLPIAIQQIEEGGMCCELVEKLGEAERSVSVPPVPEIESALFGKSLDEVKAMAV